MLLFIFMLASSNKEPQTIYSYGSPVNIVTIYSLINLRSMHQKPASIIFLVQKRENGHGP